MKAYIEAQEILPLDYILEPEFVRADVTDKTEVEITAIKNDIKDIMVGKSYQLTRHYCGHDTGEACRQEIES